MWQGASSSLRKFRPSLIGVWSPNTHNFPPLATKSQTRLWVSSPISSLGLVITNTCSGFKSAGISLTTSAFQPYSRAYSGSIPNIPPADSP